jgi:mannose-6-phosphate isomerase
LPIEHAATKCVTKPWGTADLRPWAAVGPNEGAIGEVWFERVDNRSPPPALLLKLLFTTQPLSIQVHPDDVYARSRGLPNGKSEAWYVLSAASGARVAVGLDRDVTATELRRAIADGSIADIVSWHTVAAGDVVYVPAGTVHAIGAGLVLVEIQQRSEATFRLHDYGRKRELHAEDAVAVAVAGAGLLRPPPGQLSATRRVLVASPHFVLERLDLEAGSRWELRAETETWLLVLGGHARVGKTDAFMGEAIFVDCVTTVVEVAAKPVWGLLAYVGSTASLDRLTPLMPGLPTVAAAEAHGPVPFVAAMGVA